MTESAPDGLDQAVVEIREKLRKEMDDYRVELEHELQEHIKTRFDERYQECLDNLFDDQLEGEFVGRPRSEEAEE